jgi:hypothetical protein
VSQIAISPSMADYFNAVVVEAIRSRKVDASEAAAGYLVGLLCDYAHPGEEAESTLNRPLTFLLREAQEAPAAERFRRLRTLGDGVLYAAGFFAGHMEQTGVDRSYVLNVGSTAYDQAAAMLRLGRASPSRESWVAAIRSSAARGEEREPGSGPDVLGELAEKFEKFAQVLSDVADGTLARGARDERATVKLYERWLRTGSALLAEELGARGLIPTRGAGGVN